MCASVFAFWFTFRSSIWYAQFPVAGTLEIAYEVGVPGWQGRGIPYIFFCRYVLFLMMYRNDQWGFSCYPRSLKQDLPKAASFVAKLPIVRYTAILQAISDACITYLFLITYLYLFTLIVLFRILYVCLWVCLHMYDMHRCVRICMLIFMPADVLYVDATVICFFVSSICALYHSLHSYVLLFLLQYY